MLSETTGWLNRKTRFCWRAISSSKFRESISSLEGVQEERHRIKRRRRPQCFIEGIGSLKLQLNFNLREIQWGIEGLKYRKLSAIKVLTILLGGRCCLCTICRI
jgi:hypothetical protein